MISPLREIAYKMWISEISSASFKNGGLMVRDKIVSRVNLVGTVVGRYDKGGSYSALTIDDGSGGMRVKLWNENVKVIEKVKLGDVVNVIGMLRQGMNNEIFVAPEIVRNVDANVEIMRKIEMVKELGLWSKESLVMPQIEMIKPIEVQMMVREERISNDFVPKIIGSIRQSILDCIKGSNGRTFDEVHRSLGCGEEDLDNSLQELLNEGEVYEVKGVYRVLG
jgi:hypothetical protein